MDTVPLEMDDIFGDYDGESDGEGGFNPSRLPDLEDELEPMRDMRQDDDDQGEDTEEITDNAELLAKLKSLKGASKNTTKRSMPKLDATRLTGERGMAILPKTFERVRLKGRNHEAEDLKIIMHTLQHWGHRLFPKMTFDEVLERVERLGAKKEVQTCLKKIRLDMPVLESDMIGEEEEDTVQRAGEENDEEISRVENQQDTNRMNDSHNEISDEELEGLLRDQGQPVASQPITTPSQTSPSVNSNSGLSEEVKKRIEENKRKAMERRAAKMTASNNKKDIAADSNGSHLANKEMYTVKSTQRLQPEVKDADRNADDSSFRDDKISGVSSMEKLSSSSNTQNLNEGTGSFEISGAGDVASQPESMEWEYEEPIIHKTLDSGGENNVISKNQELDTIQDNSSLHQCEKLTDAVSPLDPGEQGNEIQSQSNSSNITED
ncbi:hypothetical protein EGW08_018272 [Elysia chlorotica]|uniref:TIMELESS-interacting protein n=1 Tax=Elysia chlorotica TaxID=188477 RepID=A0A433SXH9_ELYCH|nr:hypothetical protein EGW08_018272 [Elysia chlorotica]